jgi:hypothetical protein
MKYFYYCLYSPLDQFLITNLFEIKIINVLIATVDVYGLYYLSITLFVLLIVENGIYFYQQRKWPVCLSIITYKFKVNFNFGSGLTNFFFFDYI